MAELPFGHSISQRVALWLFRQCVGWLIIATIVSGVAGLFGVAPGFGLLGVAIVLWACVEWFHFGWVTRDLSLDCTQDSGGKRLGAGETFWIDLGGPSSQRRKPSRFQIPTRFAWVTLREKEIEFAITEYGKRVTVRWDLGERATFHFQPFEMSGKRFLWLCRIEHTCPRIISPLWISSGNLKPLEQAVRKFGYPVA